MVAGRADAMAVSFRGLAAEVRRPRCGVLLQPGPLDGELLGCSRRATAPTGDRRGAACWCPIPPGGWVTAPIPIQVALA